MSALRKATCRDPRNDTLRLLRQEIDELLRSREDLGHKLRKLQEERDLLRNRQRATVRLFEAAIGIIDPDNFDVPF